ncbi:MAG TPA: molybdenum ABC transporter ATP-binding protein [Vicinamibacterales bacterium]|nr:molybdenum ABC transporter ATP-binding protein [Vicinamibacterales bacterium]
MGTLSLNVALERTGFALSVQRSVTLTGITALFGPSGSGKTSLLRVIAGLERGARGSVIFDEQVWQDERIWLPAHRRRIGYVFQDGRLFQHLTVEQNLRFALHRADRQPASDNRIGFGDAVAALDLDPLLARRPASLSGGEQQRVAIARALLMSPQLLLMDEPLSSLDVGRKREILPHIEDLPRRFNVPVLYVTHNVDEVVRLAGDVVLLAAGRVAAHGSVADIFERSDLSSFIGDPDAGAVLRTRVVEHRDGIATLALGAQRVRVPAAAALPVGATVPIRIHARDVAIATVRPQRLSIRNILTSRVLRIEPPTAIHVDLVLDVEGEHLRARITRDALEDLGLETGQTVFALIKSVALENNLLG